MNLKEQVYSVLLVSAMENFNTTLIPLFPGSKYTPLHVASNIGAAQRQLTERSYDFIIVNAPLPDGMGTRFAIDACDKGGSVVLLLVRSEHHDEIFERVASHGVFTLAKPTNKTMIQTAQAWMSSARERLRKTEKKTLSVEEKMAEIRLVNRAKWQLIDRYKMDEPEAHRFIEKQAMDRGLTKRQVAEEILAE